MTLCQEEIELEEMCLETGRITLFGLRSRARMDDVVAKAAAYCDARLMLARGSVVSCQSSNALLCQRKPEPEP
jgi:hypothetical protein